MILITRTFNHVANGDLLRKILDLSSPLRQIVPDLNHFGIRFAIAHQINVDGVDLDVLKGSTEVLKTVTLLVIKYIPNSDTKIKFIISYRVIDSLLILTLLESIFGKPLMVSSLKEY